MQRLAALAVVLTLAVPAMANAPVPRESPEFTFVGSSGMPISLSMFRGKVVVVEFLLIRCARCARVAQTIAKLQGELGPGGFQPVGVAFDQGMNGPMVARFAQVFKFTFPVGYASSEQVDSYLGRVGKERLEVPQIVVIDRAGRIRAQSLAAGNQDLESEKYLGGLIQSLLHH